MLENSNEIESVYNYRETNLPNDHGPIGDMTCPNCGGHNVNIAELSYIGENNLTRWECGNCYNNFLIDNDTDDVQTLMF